MRRITTMRNAIEIKNTIKTITSSILSKAMASESLLTLALTLFLIKFLSIMQSHVCKLPKITTAVIILAEKMVCKISMLPLCRFHCSKLIFLKRLSQKSNFAGKAIRNRKLKIKTYRLTAFPAIIRFIAFETASYFYI